MDIKNFVVILLAFCTSMLLGFGASTVFGVIGVNVCTETFCYAIKDFIQFYRTMFFTFGVLLTLITIFGLLALIWEHKKMLKLYGKFLILVLLMIMLMVWLGIWAKGPISLRSSMTNTFKMYDKGNCRIIAAVDHLQTQFKCCGIENAEDWSYLRYPSILNENSVLETPLSCCNAHLLFQKDDAVQCVTTYSKGCFAPLRYHVWQFFNIATIFAFVAALITALATIGTYKLINILDCSTRLLISQQNLINNTPVAPINILYQPDNYSIKNVPSSTMV